MSKDTYSTILSEIKEVVKQILGLRKRTLTMRDKVGKERDKVQIQKIRKEMGLK
ncbi:hypothetical protein HY477_00865 [Candidatus Uhrbacteria bacterium]|nr:hypothetical protein [Candidatus Uhrbacteria bacterium]